MSLIVLTADAKNHIRNSRAPGGELKLRYSEADDLFVVSNVEISNNNRRSITPTSAYTALGSAKGVEGPGQWLRDVPADANIFNFELLHRPGTSVTFEDFESWVPTARRPRSKMRPILLVTYRPDLPEQMLQAGVQEFAAWQVTPDRVTPVGMAVEPDVVGLDQLQPQWPIADLAHHRVGVVGVGSIGGVVADDLAAYGVGTIDLIDPDRFLWHNSVRHILDSQSVGRLKVNAMRDRLRARWPDLTVKVHPVDFTAHAHRMRSLMPKLDVLACAADGVAARRVASHLSRQANIPAVLACVLGDGTVGEILRLRPGPAYGCLMCQRAKLAAKNGMDIEATQERGYDDGGGHRPMTAVGPDLWAVGHLAAKATIATLLEGQHGDNGHRLPGDLAIMGLRPVTPYDAPYDVATAGAVAWHDIPPPQPDCPTCGTS